MHHITIDASPKQLSKLRNGHPVRIKHGTGFNLIIHPHTYRLVARAFNKGVGTQITLSPEEIQANAQASAGQPVAIQNPQAPDQGLQSSVIEGKGIFGSVGDRVLKKAGIRNMAYKLGDYAKPAVKAGITAALQAGGTALGVAQPELAPFIPGGVMGASMLASDYLDHPSRYIGKSGHSGIKGHKLSNLAEQSAQVQMTDQLNNALGTNMDYLRNANLQNAIAQSAQGQLNASSTIAKQYVPQVQTTSFNIPPPPVIYGEGMHHYSHHMRQHAITGRGGGMLASSSYTSPALASQPFGANFQFKHFMPPQYQSLIHGSGLY